MNFWETFYQESMGSPWVITTNTEPSLFTAPWTFVLESQNQTPAYEQMVQRMVAAIGKTEAEVSIAWVKDISQWKPEEGQEKALLFGVEGRLGQFEDFESTSVMITHDLVELAKDPRKKKETWMHLQKFAGLK